MVTQLFDLLRRPGGEGAVTEPPSTPTTSIEEIRAQFSGLSLLDTLDDETLRAIESEIEWLSIPGGWELFHQDDPGDGLYIVKSGCLGVMMEGPDGEAVLATQIHPGQIVGEMSLISGLPRSATVTAFRDTEVYRLKPDSFMRLAQKKPELLTRMNKILVRRLQRMTSLQTPVDISRSFAIVPVGAGMPVANFARQLCDALGTLGFRAHIFDETSIQQPTEWFDKVERDFDLSLYVASGELDDWTRQCFRQADRVLLLADPSAPPVAGPAFDGIMGRARVQPVETVFLQPSGAHLPLPVGNWLDQLETRVHWQIRRGDREHAYGTQGVRFQVGSGRVLHLHHQRSGRGRHDGGTLNLLAGEHQRLFLGECDAGPCPAGTEGGECCQRTGPDQCVIPVEGHGSSFLLG